MLSKVADTSAVLAVLFSEPGATRAQELIAGSALMTSVNYSEVLSRYVALLTSFDDAKRLTRSLVGAGSIVAFDEDLAERAAKLLPLTKTYGLSLGDRACLALAERERLPVVTAERTWTKLDLGIEIQLIR